MINLESEIDSLFPRDCTVVFFHAHADDESFLCAGLIQELVKRGRKCLIAYAATALVKGQQKTEVRQREVQNACEILGITDIRYLKFCEPKYFEDGAIRLIEQSPNDVCTELHRILNFNNVTNRFVLVSYDKNGGYGNQDHKIVHEAGKIFSNIYTKDLFAYYEITINRGLINEWLKHAEARLPKNSLPKLSYWSKEFGLQEGDITYFYKLSKDTLTLKKTAMRAHASQITEGEFPLVLSNDDFDQIFGREFLHKVF